jgi:hypothetical protein
MFAGGLSASGLESLHRIADGVLMFSRLQRRRPRSPRRNPRRPPSDDEQTDVEFDCSLWSKDALGCEG